VGADHDQPLRRASRRRDREQRDDGVDHLDGIRPRAADVRPQICAAVQPELVGPAGNDPSETRENEIQRERGGERERERKKER